jgi:hypothetical protein
MARPSCSPAGSQEQGSNSPLAFYELFSSSASGNLPLIPEINPLRTRGSSSGTVLGRQEYVISILEDAIALIDEDDFGSPTRTPNPPTPPTPPLSPPRRQ